MIVRAISRELEKVLVEQYHCQGFSTVTHSCSSSQQEKDVC